MDTFEISRLRDLTGISEGPAFLVVETVPLRGTREWAERELIRLWAGNKCIGLSEKHLRGLRAKIGRGVTLQQFLDSGLRQLAPDFGQL